MMDGNLLCVKVSNLHLEHPVMTASGILDETGESMLRLAHAGASAVVSKSIGEEPRSGHPTPCVVDIGVGVLNAVGLANPGARIFGEEIEIYRQRTRVPLVVSVFAADAEGFARMAGWAADAGASAVELNLSCPNAEGLGAEIGSDPAAVRTLCSAASSVVDIPVWAKVTPNVRDVVSLGAAALEGGADALVAINTIRAAAIDVQSRLPVLSSGFGGLSGAALRPVGVRAVFELYRETGAHIVGVGGISSWEHALENILSGARAVQVGTALKDGLEVLGKIRDGISSYLQERGERLVDIVGLATG